MASGKKGGAQYLLAGTTEIYTSGWEAPFNSDNMQNDLNWKAVA